MAKATEVGQRTLLVTKNNGEQFRITVPGDSKVTFGYFNPMTGAGDGRRSRYDEGEHDGRRTCLRIYRGSKENGEQLAAFLGVREYRDTSLPIERLVKKSVGKAAWEGDTEGNFQESKSVVVTKELVTDQWALGPGEGDELP